MLRDKEEHFAYRVAAAVTFGYAFSVSGATYVDARLTTHVRYPPRTYEYGYWIIILAIPLFVATVVGIRRARTRGWKVAASSLPLVLAVASSEWVFAPEVPHNGVTTSCAVYGGAVLLATWLRHSRPDSRFLADTTLPLQVRIEGLKSAITLWHGLALATTAGFLAGLVPWALGVMNVNARMVGAAKDLFLLNELAMFQVAALSIVFLACPIREVVVAVMHLTGLFETIRADDTPLR